MDRIDQVRRKHEAALLAIPGVVGVGIVDGEAGEPAIAVYVSGDDVAPSVPASLDGVPVRVVVSGEMDAFGQ